MTARMFICLAAICALVAPAASQGLPPGTVACEMAGYSIDNDPKGANVRAEPNAKAKVLGKLAPPQKASKREDTYPNDGVWRTSFQIVGFRDGWFLIEKALHPFDDERYFQPTGRRSTGGVKTYRGRGWIASNLVGGQYSNKGQLPSGALYSEPRADAARTPAKNALGAEVGADGGPKKVLACDGDWVKVESHDGVVGWWNSLCSQQVTNCS